MILGIGDGLASKAAISTDLCPKLDLDNQSSVISINKHCETKKFIFS